MRDTNHHAQQERAVAVARQWVREHHRVMANEMQVVFIGVDDEAGLCTVDVIAPADVDEASTRAGGGESRRLLIDTLAGTVTRELRFQ